MSAFSSLILLISIAAISMALVAYANYQVAKKKRLQMQLRKMKIEVEDLEEAVLLLDGLCPQRIIPKMINDEVIESYEEMINISPGTSYLKAGLANAQKRGDELSNEVAPRIISRICSSDAQIARSQAYLDAAIHIVRKHYSNGKISNSSMQEILNNINWLYLQVKVIATIVEGHKAYVGKGAIVASSYYKKAQRELIQSSLPHPDRKEMIVQLGAILGGKRHSLDESLMPETEFNPENNMDIEIKEVEEEQSILSNEEDAFIHQEQQDAKMASSKPISI